MAPITLNKHLTNKNITQIIGKQKEEHTIKEIIEYSGAGKTSVQKYLKLYCFQEYDDILLPGKSPGRSPKLCDSVKKHN